MVVSSRTHPDDDVVDDDVVILGTRRSYKKNEKSLSLSSSLSALDALEIKQPAPRGISAAESAVELDIVT